ncbi:hypothetical protein [Catenulispora rubra]|uniref:hypothetical protein n=1 Tax=Catenulispora rubra TaxID=280293 RepID=UPI0018923889|nr:hypothetical protein [Catenulispora rubra]
MRLLLVLAVGLLPVGVIMCWVGARSLRQRVRATPAAEVEIVYDPADITVARERFWLAEAVVATLCVVTGLAVTVSGVATVVLAIVVFA